MQIYNPIVNAYTKYAKNYDLAVKLYPLLGINIEKYRDRTVNALNLQKGDLVVELGCGTGLNFQRVLEKIGPKGKLIGIDVTEKMLEVARKRIKEHGWNNVELVHKDIAEYEFPKEIDGIFATGALQYSIKHEQIVKRGHDTLKHGKSFEFWILKCQKELQKYLHRCCCVLQVRFLQMKNIYKEKHGSQFKNILKR